MMTGMMMTMMMTIMTTIRMTMMTIMMTTSTTTTTTTMMMMMMMMIMDYGNSVGYDVDQVMMIILNALKSFSYLWIGKFQQRPKKS